ncbi:MAG TPA: hypothetical protein VFV38_06040 [Ktedonobacteraceae bacterium]|nr:hypothetical protein [Ktedonobacteraceae bacterium]
MQTVDGRELLSTLEGLRQDIPGPLQGAFEDVIQLVRSIVDAVEQIVAPPNVIHDGKHQLLNHHTTLTGHATTLKTNLTDFQTVYTGSGSDAYFLTASQAHQQLNLLTDHLSFAVSSHDTIATNLGDAQLAQRILFGIIAAFVFTLFLLPEGVPAFAAEGAGGGFSVAALWTAINTVGSTLAGLATAALPYVAAGTLTLVAVATLSGDSSQVQVQQSSISIDIGLANDPVIDKWRDAIRNALKAKGLTDAQIALALATAAAIVKALECAGLTPAEIASFMSEFGNLYNPKIWANASKGSFWYSLAVLVLAATGGTVRISPMNIPYPVSANSIINARRVVRALLDPTGFYGDDTPIPGGVAAITGGPGNVKAFGQVYYVGPKGALTQKEFNKLPPAEKPLYQ